MPPSTETKSSAKAAAKPSVKKKSGKTIQIHYFRSVICTPKKHKAVVKGLGFTHLNQVVVREDSPSIRGMVGKVPHLLQIIEK